MRIANQTKGQVKYDPTGALYLITDERLFVNPDVDGKLLRLLLTLKSTDRRVEFLEDFKAVASKLEQVNKLREDAALLEESISAKDVEKSKRARDEFNKALKDAIKGVTFTADKKLDIIIDEANNGNESKAYAVNVINRVFGQVENLLRNSYQEVRVLSGDNVTFVDAQSLPNFEDLEDLGNTSSTVVDEIIANVKAILSLTGSEEITALFLQNPVATANDMKALLSNQSFGDDIVNGAVLEELLG